MASFETNSTRFAAARPAGVFAYFLSGVIAQLVAWNDARATRKALNRLSDHELSDIGLCRGDIEDVAGHR
ncbi:MAG: DUF1127 domain-containing protein [Roseivivax sp.]|nr:DUF1127 domain-containing protein [Roseivivax sp.]